MIPCSRLNKMCSVWRRAVSDLLTVNSILQIKDVQLQHMMCKRWIDDFKCTRHSDESIASSDLCYSKQFMKRNYHNCKMSFHVTPISSNSSFNHYYFSLMPKHVTAISTRFFSDGRTPSYNDLLNMVGKTQTAVHNTKAALLRPRNLMKSAEKIISDHNMSDLSTEKQLRVLMSLWEMEKAVCVLKYAVLNGVKPDRTILLDLLQQLANLGEVDCLLELHHFMKEHKLTTSQQFYHILGDAYHNSGRIEEGIGVLRLIYHGSRDFNDADILFTLLATMILKDFDHQRSLILQYVEDLEAGNPPVPARSSLWQCYILAEKFEDAEALLKEYPELKSLIPAQVTKFTQSQLQIDYNKDIVFEYLLNLDLIKPGLKASVFDYLIRLKSEENEWGQVLDHLSAAMESGLKIHKHTVSTFLSQFLGQLSSAQVDQLKQWAETLVDEEETDNS